MGVHLNRYIVLRALSLPENTLGECYKWCQKLGHNIFIYGFYGSKFNFPIVTNGIDKFLLICNHLRHKLDIYTRDTLGQGLLVHVVVLTLTVFKVVLSKLQIGSHNSIQMYQLGTFIHQKDLLGQCRAFLKIWGSKVKGQVHQMTKYGQNYSFDSITPFSVSDGNFANGKDLFGH